jgi:hypothetical protein
MKFTRLFLVFVSIWAAGCSTVRTADSKAVVKVPASPRLNLLGATQAAALYLRGMVHPDGQLTYRIELKTGKSVSSYNIVRHAGAIYALCQFETKFHDPQTQDAIIRASQFLLSSSVFALPEFNASGESMSAVFSIPTVSHDASLIHAPLGATGLGLVALLKAEEIVPGIISAENLNRLGNFLVFMQNKDGSFYDVYAPKGGRKKTVNSLYYPGETIYALTLLYKKDHNPKWLKSAINGMNYLAQSRANLPQVPADNWALIATEELMSVRDHLPPEVIPLWISHAVQICRSDIAGQILDPNKIRLYGGYTSTGRTTQTSARLEGLLSALNFLPPEQIELKNQLLDSIKLGIDFVMRAQIQTGTYRGAVPDSQPPPTGTPETREVQIDYVQHALSAFLRYGDVVAGAATRH